MNARSLAYAVVSAASLFALAGMAVGAPPADVGASTPAAQARAKPQKMWVFLKDKGFASRAEQDAAVLALKDSANPRQVARRQARRSIAGLFDASDLPVDAGYRTRIEATGAKIHVESRWLNAVSVYATPEQVAALRGLDCVAEVRPVLGGKRRGTDGVPTKADTTVARSFYGYTEDQTNQVNLAALHGAGFTGEGVVIGILDTGFHRTHQIFTQPLHPLVVLAEHDFINNDGNTDIEGGDYGDQHVHGTLILSVIGGYLPGTFVGGAYDAHFVLCKTEDVTSETPIEEDNYVGGLELCEAQGADITTSSLGYIDWYTQADLDGQTAVTTIAVNIANNNGLHCCTAAGNEGNDGNPSTSTLIAPADAFRVITCGAVDSGGSSAWFTSTGPTADGRIKPEVMARGVDTLCVWPYDDYNYATASGTSLSTPVVASVVACLTGARPSWSVDRMRTYVTRSASDYAATHTTDPLFIRGFGIVNAYQAYLVGCPADFDGNGFVNGDDYDAFATLFDIGNTGADFNGDGFVNGNDYDAFASAFDAGC
ncbi:MAG: S8 family serine peptidase [Phycisphaerales bacterium]